MHCRQRSQQERERPQGRPLDTCRDVSRHVADVGGEQLDGSEPAEDECQAVEELGQVQAHLVGVFGACKMQIGVNEAGSDWDWRFDTRIFGRWPKTPTFP